MLSPLRLSAFRVPDDNARGIRMSARAPAWWLRVVMALVVLLLLGLLPAPPSHAQVIEATEARIDYQDGGFELAASFEFELPPSVEDALNKGISLYFAVDFQLTRPRWYWFDERSVNATRTVRLSYQPLTRQYRVSTGGLQLSFSRLKGALQFIQQVRGWRVFERNAVQPGQTYQAEVRMRLDLSQLPKPFQINAVNTRDWQLQSEWRHFNFTVPTEFPPPAPPAPPMPVAPPAPPPASGPGPAAVASPPIPQPPPGPASAPASAPVSRLEQRATPYTQTIAAALFPGALAQPPVARP